MKTIRDDANEAPMFRYKKKTQKHLLKAIKCNKVKDVIQMLKKGCSPSEGYKSRYPLDTAIKYWNVEIISILLQQGAHISKPIQSSRWSPLHRVTVWMNTALSHQVHLVGNFVLRRKYFKANHIYNKELKIIKILNIYLNANADVNMQLKSGNTPLYLSVKKKLRKVAEYLIGRGADLIVSDFINRDKLAHLIVKKQYKANVKCLMLMLDQSDINACKNNSEIVLHVLSNLTNDEDDIANVTHALVVKGIGINKINKDNMTTVQLATLQKNKGMLKLLEIYAADFYVQTISRESLLHLAVGLNDEQTFGPEQEDKIINVLQILLDAGLDVNAKTNNGETPFYLAVKNKMRKVIEFLIDEGADLDVCNHDGDSVAHYLVKEEFQFRSSTYDDGISSDDKVCSKEKESLDFIDWLLSKGLNVDLKNDYGQSPLQLAVKYNLLRVIAIFLKYANDVSFINDSKLTILHMLLQSSDEDSFTVTFDVKNIVSTLLTKGVSVDIKDSFQNTALHIAAQQKQPDLISILLQYTTDVNVANELGWTPLHFACESSNVEVVKKLIDHGADVNIIEDITGLTPLFVAVYNDNEEVIEVLAEAGADLNARDATGQTALHMVDSMKNSMSTLLRLGADVDAKDNWGRVPLYYAMTRQDNAAIGMLLDFDTNVSRNTLTDFVLKELLASDRVMGRHAKLMAAQLSIPKMYTSLAFRNYLFYYKTCLDEVMKMRFCQIDDNTTLYDFLHMDPKRRQTYESKEKFQDVMKLSSLTKEFPLYCDIICAKRLEARNKRSLIKSATYAWWELTDILLPDICLENIFANVDNMTLKDLCAGTKTMKRPADVRLEFNPMKRRRLM